MAAGWKVAARGSVPPTHRHFLQVAVVIADRQTVELLLQLPHALVVEVARGDEPILVLLLQHFLEATLQELLLQQLLLHLGTTRGGGRRQDGCGGGQAEIKKLLDRRQVAF